MYLFLLVFFVYLDFFEIFFGVRFLFKIFVVDFFFDFMMIMTIWWSKATRLLEFSRSRPQAEPDLRTRLFCDRGGGQRTEELGILVVGFTSKR